MQRCWLSSLTFTSRDGGCGMLTYGCEVESFRISEIVWNNDAVKNSSTAAG
jgi:hypothetical protein